MGNEFKPLIYVAGPYSSDTPDGIMKNVNRAIDVGLQLKELGFLPIVPHLSHWFDQRHLEKFGELAPYEFYMELDEALITFANGVYKIGDSPGVERELAVAEDFFIPVYTTLTDLVRGYKLK